MQRCIPLFSENAPCQNQNEPGTCTQFLKCDPAKKFVKLYKTHNFTRCGFAGISELICCPVTTPLRLNNLTRKCEDACEAYTQTYSNVVFPHIVGGQNAKVGQFPYMAALGFYSEINSNYNFRCGGTLISDKYVVTAAHCLWNLEEEEVKIVRLGATSVPALVDKIDEKLDYKVKNYTIHPGYRRRSNIHDIALIEVVNSIELRDDLRPACLFTNGSNYPQEFTIAGWGIVDDSKFNK